jgi:hypothetical protein
MKYGRTIDHMVKSVKSELTKTMTGAELEDFRVTVWIECVGFCSGIVTMYYSFN